MNPSTDSTSVNLDTQNTNNTSNTTSPIQEVSPTLAQNKIPSEMLAPYTAPSDYESNGYDFQYMSYDPSQAMMSQLNPYYQYQMSYYDPYYGGTTSYMKDFLRAKDYRSEDAILEVFPHLEGLNDTDFDIEKVSPNAHFYILRSSNDDNIHKAIKYHMWTSTPSGKNVLKKAWEEFEEAEIKPDIYFLFTVVNSNQFLGIAKMMSNVNPEDSFKYWWEPCKWFGTFQLQWLFIKDIHYSYFEHIREEGHPTSVVNLRDGTKISAESGKEILNVFKNYPVENSIFDSFEYMDRREDFIRAQRDSDPKFQQFFEESRTLSQNTQDGYSYKKPYYYRPNGRRPNNRKYSTPISSNGSNGYYQKNRYHKKSEDIVRFNYQDFPPMGQSVENTENPKQMRKYSEGTNYKRRNQNYRPGNGYHGQQKTYDGYRDRQQKVKPVLDAPTDDTRERERTAESESNGSQGKQEEFESQGESREKVVYGDHSQLC